MLASTEEAFNVKIESPLQLGPGALAKNKNRTRISHSYGPTVLRSYGPTVLRSYGHEYLTPLALAVWILNDGGAESYGLKIATNNLTFIQVNLLC